MSHAVRVGEAPPSVPDERLARRSPLARLLARPEIGSLAGAVVIYVFFFAVAEPFRGLDSLATILYASSTLGIPAVGVALLMIGGEFDLSAGVAVTSASLVASMLSFQLTMNVWVGVAVSLLLALGVGALNGYLVMKTGIPSFLVTLATFLMLQGLNLAITKLITGNVASPDISDMDGFGAAQKVFAAEWDIGGLSLRISVLWWLLFAAIATWVLLRTRVGNWIFAVGGAQSSARAVGVPVKGVKIGLFMTVGFLAWFTGMNLLFSFNTVQSGEGVGNEFLYIIAAVIGGCLLTGGYGSAVGAATGAFIFGMTTQGIVYAGWNPDWFKFFLGAMLLFATLLNLWVRRRTEAAR
ncbi:ABC transporter permease [Actinoallomurus vinaceus]|uniref:Xylose transport system permease protein XylH n=1 Tax=Actinoallomurus vinaceus TaxID=1080074 RepID=A0ABP8U625_9ACTN